jgi:hypothetical protein
MAEALVGYLGLSYTRMRNNNDLRFLVVMVSTLETMTKRNLRHFSKALVMGHSIKWNWTWSFFFRWDKLFGLSCAQNLGDHQLLSHVTFPSNFWHVHPRSFLVLMIMCTTKWNCMSFLHQWENLRSGGHGHWSLVNSVNMHLGWKDFIFIVA